MATSKVARNRELVVELERGRTSIRMMSMVAVAETKKENGRSDMSFYITFECLTEKPKYKVVMIVIFTIFEFDVDVVL